MLKEGRYFRSTRKGLYTSSMRNVELEMLLLPKTALAFLLIHCGKQFNQLELAYPHLGDRVMP